MKAQLEKQMKDAYTKRNYGQDGIPIPNLNGLPSLDGVKPFLALVPTDDIISSTGISNKARERGYKSADRKQIKDSIDKLGFKKELTIPVLIKLSNSHSYRKVNGWTRISLYGPDGYRLDLVLVWVLPDVISDIDEKILAGRLNPNPPKQSPLTRKDAIVMAMEAIASDNLAKNEKAIENYVELLSEAPDDVNYNIRDKSWKTRTINEILREAKVGPGRLATYTTDESANTFYLANNITMPYYYNSNRVVKVHGIQASNYKKLRTDNIIVRLNGNDDYALSTMDSLAMRRNAWRVSNGLSPLTTHVHVDVELVGGRDVNVVRQLAQDKILNFVKLMKQRGTHTYHWVIDGFYPKDPDVDTMSQLLEWKYNPSK